MRSHTLSAHDLQITKYKEIHGQFEILQVPLLKLLHLGMFPLRRLGCTKMHESQNVMGADSQNRLLYYY